MDVLDLVIQSTEVQVQRLYSFWNTSDLLLNTKLAIWRTFCV